MKVFRRLFGSRWSIYFIEGGTPRYAMYEDSVVRMLGYLMGSFERNGGPMPPWEIRLRFRDKSLQLTNRCFSEDGNDLSAELLALLREADPFFDRLPGEEPDFVDLHSKKRLRLCRVASRGDTLDLEAPRQETMFDVFDQIFGERVET